MKKYKNLIEKQRELIFVYTTNFDYGSPYTDQLESEIAAIEKEIEEEEKKDDKESNLAQAWECPRCHKIHSYLSLECDCPPRVITATTYNH